MMRTNKITSYTYDIDVAQFVPAITALDLLGWKAFNLSTTVYMTQTYAFDDNAPKNKIIVKMVGPELKHGHMGLLNKFGEIKKETVKV